MTSSSSSSNLSFDNCGFSITENNTYNIDLSTFENGPYVVNPMGNYACCGLNMLGPSSIISFQNDYWKFYAFVTGKEHAIYFNKDGHTLIIDKFKMYDLPIKRMCVPE